jgi:hypothetical protein
MLLSGSSSPSFSLTGNPISQPVTDERAMHGNIEAWKRNGGWNAFEFRD